MEARNAAENTSGADWWRGTESNRPQPECKTSSPPWHMPPRKVTAFGTVRLDGIEPSFLVYQTSVLTIGRQADRSWVDRADSNRLTPGSQSGPSTTSGSANINGRRGAQRQKRSIQLSYLHHRWGEGRDSNPRPLGGKPCSPCCIRPRAHQRCTRSGPRESNSPSPGSKPGRPPWAMTLKKRRRRCGEMPDSNRVPT